VVKELSYYIALCASISETPTPVGARDHPDVHLAGPRARETLELAALDDLEQGAFPVCTAGFQHLSPDWPSAMSRKLLFKIQRTTPTHPPPSRGRRLLPCPVLPLPTRRSRRLCGGGGRGQGEGEHEMAHEDKQGMHPVGIMAVEIPVEIEAFFEVSPLS